MPNGCGTADFLCATVASTPQHSVFASRSIVVLEHPQTLGCQILELAALLNIQVDYRRFAAQEPMSTRPPDFHLFYSKELVPMIV